ncbi:hypothetical protein KZI27_19325 [Curtobacterium sp. TC1]|uniref:hypothetical protein n=1 Tax=Curtobacterium sp. TC1 TaxID=2862880 RepID=UPI001C9B221C|nr:hypothetical protein [Curtobacterium sp. TC1]QZQ55360.1 hypothetical protein KZI27_19325 [Curtobacterium sp. TC1]
MPEFRPMPGYELGDGRVAARRRRSRFGRVWRWIGPPVALVAVVAAALLFHWYAGVADQVEWECAVSTCGTNDPRSFAPEGCWALLVLAALGVGRLPGRWWWRAGLLLAFALVAAWSIDWWRMPGIDLGLFVTPIGAGGVGAVLLLARIGIAVDRARGRAHTARRRAEQGSPRDVAER